MRMTCSLILTSALLLPLQAMAQTGGVAGSGSAGAGVTTGIGGNTATSPAGSSSTGAPRVTMPGPPGTNAAGTALSSGPGSGKAVGNTAEDETIRAEDPKIDKKIKSICRGC